MKLKGPCIGLRTEDDVKRCSIGVVMMQAMGLREEAARGGEEMNRGTLWYSKWELGSKESGSQWAVGKLLAWCSLLHPH